MSKRIEDRCVDCGLPCVGSACRYYPSFGHYCDYCEVEAAEYIIDGEELCAECAEAIIRDRFDCLSLYEKAAAIGVNLMQIG